MGRLTHAAAASLYHCWVSGCRQQRPKANPNCYSQRRVLYCLLQIAKGCVYTQTRGKVMKAPTTFAELFDFYYDRVKPLYVLNITRSQLPAEMLFEQVAALDHLSRHWRFSETEKDVVLKAYQHLSRSCFDAFKMILLEATKQYEEIRRIDTASLDDGDFGIKLRELAARMRNGAIRAREAEGEAGSESDEDAFTLWERVFADCVKLEQEFYLNPVLARVKKRHLAEKALENLVSVGIGVAMGLVLGISVWWIRDYGSGFIAGALSGLFVWFVVQIPSVKRTFSALLAREAEEERKEELSPERIADQISQAIEGRVQELFEHKGKGKRGKRKS